MQSEGHLKILLKKAESQFRAFNGSLVSIVSQMTKLQKKKAQLEHMISVRTEEIKQLKVKIQNIKNTQIKEVGPDNWKNFF